MYKIKSSWNFFWIGLEFLHGTPKLKKSTMEVVNGFSHFLEVWWILIVMVVVLHHVLYYFNTIECLETICWFMAVMPWFLLYISIFSILGKTLYYNFLLDTMTHNTSHSLRLRTIYNNNMVINLKNAHILVVLFLVKQIFWLCSNSTNNFSLHACSLPCKSSFLSSPRSMSASSLELALN
jgi:hypothetical protein